VTLRSRDLDKRITFQTKVPVAGVMNAGKEAWENAGTVWAQVTDQLYRRGDKEAAGVEVTARSARIRIRKPGFAITADMRILFGARVMHIIGAPAELAARDGYELMGEDYSTTGQPA